MQEERVEGSEERKWEGERWVGGREIMEGGDRTGWKERKGEEE